MPGCTALPKANERTWGQAVHVSITHLKELAAAQSNYRREPLALMRLEKVRPSAMTML